MFLVILSFSMKNGKPGLKIAIDIKENLVDDYCPEQGITQANSYPISPR
jgi:hypothetical protein